MTDTTQQQVFDIIAKQAKIDVATIEAADVAQSTGLP